MRPHAQLEGLDVGQLARQVVVRFLGVQVQVVQARIRELLQHAEHLALHGIVHAARKLLNALQLAGKHNSLESETIRAHILAQLATLAQLNDAVDT